MKFVLCEDEETSLKWMQKAIIKWGQAKKELVDLISYNSAEELLFKENEWIKADGLILDIELKAMNGMELAKKIRIRDEHIPILFATGYEQFVFEGYEVGAISYLMKPVNEEKLFRALDKMKEKSKENKEVFFTNAEEENTKLYLVDIMYIESEGHYVTIQDKKEHKEVRRSIGDLWKELKYKQFCMPHRSYLVNIAHINKITKKMIYLDNGIEIPIARGKWEEINKAYLEYYRGR